MPLATDIFVDGGYDGVSGVLYSGSKIFSLPVPRGTEFTFVRNARAANGLRKGFFQRHSPEERLLRRPRIEPIALMPAVRSSGGTSPPFTATT
jgi:hypothetical protein